MTKYFEKSKHDQMTAAVTHHFFTGDGAAHGKQFAKGGTPAYNGDPMPFPAETGVNYTPPSKAGNRTR